MNDRRYVLDAWAILALLQQEEPAASRVRTLFSIAEDDTVALFISVINLGEIYYRIGKVRGQPEADQTLELLQQLPLTIVPATNEMVFKAAAYKIRHSISYADAFAVATSNDHDGTLVTGDPELIALAAEIDIETLSRH